MALAPGSRLGSYEIVSPLGAGGMGEVYRARDVRLGRTVALKVLPESFAADEDLRARLAAEARTLSRIAHPNICTLFDVGVESGTTFLVLEHLQGETLADRVARGPLPFADVLRIGIAICAALDGAHAAGIIHRDLKPANVMLTEATGGAAGQVKLLDFGIAKTVAPIASGDPTSALLSMPGRVIGTPSYIAPEQLHGRPADVRSDIFSLGVVLYEMATGTRAFAGDTPVALAAAVLSTDPPAPSAGRASIPPAFDLIVRRALEKDPEARWQSVRDVRWQLEALRHAPAATAVPFGRSRSIAVVPWIVAGVAIAAAAVRWIVPAAATPHRTEPVGFTVERPPGASAAGSVEGNTLALSPDGARIAWIGGSIEGRPVVWQRTLARPDAARPLAGTEGATTVFWSPDSQWIGFVANGALQRIAADGGAALTMCPVQAGLGYTATWGPGGIVLFAPIQGEAIFRVAASGGTPAPAVTANRAGGERRVGWPWFVGDRGAAVFISHTQSESRLMLLRPDGSTAAVADIATEAQYADPGYLVFTSRGALVAQRFDPATGTLSEDPIPLAPHVNVFEPSGWAGFSVSRTGTIAFESMRDEEHLTFVDEQGLHPEAVGDSAAFLDDLQLAADGRSAYVSRVDPTTGAYAIWSLDLDRGTWVRVTTGPGSLQIGAVPLPDGRSFAFSATLGGSPQLYLHNGTSGTDARLVPGETFQVATSRTRDGRTLIFHERPDRGTWDIMSVELGGGAPVPLVHTQYSEMDGRLSPDGRALAFTSDETGREEVYVAPFPGAATRARVSTAGGSRPRWSADGRRLFFLADDGMLLSAAVASSPELTVGKPSAQFAASPPIPWVDFAPMPDGRRLLAIVPHVLGRNQPLTVITHALPER